MAAKCGVRGILALNSIARNMKIAGWRLSQL
jgi:hypothetical protein